jgi:pimeloyl-ACP methyl ester carboxylesterase
VKYKAWMPALVGTTLLAVIVYLAARAAERRNPPTGKFITVDGVRLHYAEQGEGPVVVLLHGNTVMLQDYVASGVFDAAAMRCRVIAFDRPGFGYSERPRTRVWTPIAQANLLEGALRQLGVERAVVVGHSWGALVAVAMALNHRDIVRSLVLLSGFYYPRPRLDVLLASPPAIPLIGDVLRYTISPILQALSLPLMLRQMFGPPSVPQQFKKLFPLSMMLRPWQIRATAAEAALMIPSALKLRSRYRELAVPVEIIAGDRDRVVTTSRQSARLHAELPASVIQDVKDAGHMVHHVAPDLVLSAIFSAALAPDTGSPASSHHVSARAV